MDTLDKSFAAKANYLSNLNELPDEKSLIYEFHILQEWGNIQHYFVTHMLHFAFKSGDSCRDILERSIDRCTQSQAKIQWEPETETVDDSQFLAIRSQQCFYGVLQLSPGYLVSRLVPSLPQRLAGLCAIFLILAEHQALVHSLLKPLQPIEVPEALTPRQLHVLQCMTLGENEMSIATHLNLSVTTIRTHRQHIYDKLNVHSSQEAILRSFEHKLLDWTRWPYSNSTDEHI